MKLFDYVWAAFGSVLGVLAIVFVFVHACVCQGWMKDIWLED